MSGTRYLLDTNVLIGFLGGASWAASFFEQVATTNPDLLVSSVTRMELLGFPGIIAATALTREAALVTADEDFGRVAGLEVIHPHRP